MRAYSEDLRKKVAEVVERGMKAWRVMIATTLDVRRLVFVDECGTHTSLAPLYAWPPLR